MIFTRRGSSTVRKFFSIRFPGIVVVGVALGHRPLPTPCDVASSGDEVAN